MLKNNLAAIIFRGMKKMITWSYAFKKGFIIFLWSIVWGIVGAVIALIISGGSLLAMIASIGSSSSYYGYEPAAAIGSIIGIFAGMIIGSLVAGIGNYATIVKIVLESVEETKKAPAPTA